MTYARDCIIFSCILLVSNSIVLVQFQKRYTRFQRLQIALVFRTRAILIVFEKLSRFFEIALETILLPIQTTYYIKQHIRTMQSIYKQRVYIYRFIKIPNVRQRTWMIAVNASLVSFNLSNSFRCIRDNLFILFRFNISIRVGWFQGLKLTTVDDD